MSLLLAYAIFSLIAVLLAAPVTAEQRKEVRALTYLLVFCFWPVILVGGVVIAVWTYLWQTEYDD